MIGAILVFALNIEVDWIDLNWVGYLLMGAGVVVFLIGLILMVRRRRSISTVHTSTDAATGQRVTQRETDVDPL